ncbi:serine/threonine protein kinase [Bacillus daqingensis]|uniref:Serine/threonine protein kinase n=1 Tax=Bacillus daqingensis TaxID=872396 RepID=A0ABV9NSH6_9BACI
METTWLEQMNQISITAVDHNEPVLVSGIPEGVRCVGIGTDAAVFQSAEHPEYAVKLYAGGREAKAAEEFRIYKLLAGSAYFPVCTYQEGRLLVMSFEAGTTFYDCLLQGTEIPETAVEEVEEARQYVRSRGLNPRDIHLKNILLQENGIKILDVSEYGKPGNDMRWEHLKEAYEEVYSLIRGKALPLWLLETIRKWYNRREKYFQSYEEFKQFCLKMLRYRAK